MVLPWVIQGESAGHFVAVDQGYYEDAGLDVEIIPGGPDVDSRRLLASGSAQFAVSSTPGIILARNAGIPLVGLWTQNQESGSGLVCKTETGIDSWDDLDGQEGGHLGRPWRAENLLRRRDWQESARTMSPGCPRSSA